MKPLLCCGALGVEESEDLVVEGVVVEGVAREGVAREGVAVHVVQRGMYDVENVRRDAVEVA